MRTGFDSVEEVDNSVQHRQIVDSHVCLLVAG